jgi:hypothetical protein
VSASSRVVVALAMLSSCTGSDADEELEVANIGGLQYAVPAGWKSQDQSEHQNKIIVWRPSDNPRKESIALIRSKELPALVKGDFGHIEQFLAEAQKSSSDGTFTAVTRFKTNRGLVGARTEGDLVPDAASHTTYRRMHAVLIDGTSLVHVLYTARNPNPKTFRLVLDSLIRKDA